MARNKLSFNPAIAHPCHESWAEMTGSQRERHCQSCGKQVHNFAAMTPREIERLAREKEGELCARITHRTDGSLVTLDVTPRPSLAAQIAVSASLFVGAAGAIAQNPAPRPQEPEAVLSGTVLSSDGSGPMEGALISLRNGSVTVAETKTDAQGGFRLSTSPGTYDIEIKKGPKDGMQFHKVALVEGELNLPSFTSGTTVSVNAYDAGESYTTMGTMSVTIGRYSLSYIFRHPVAYVKHLVHKL